MPLRPTAPLALLAVAGLSACVAKTPPPPEFTDFATNVQIAQLLAQGCPSVTANQAGMGAGARDLGVVLRGQGFSSDDISNFPNTLDVSVVQARTQAYVTANDIIPSDWTTVCPVAQREMKQGTAIAAFLKAA